MSNDMPTPPGPSFGRRMAIAFTSLARAVLRLLFAAIVAVGIALALYFGFPALYSQYVQPVNKNTSAIAMLSARQDISGTQVAARLDTVQSRLDALEVQGDADKELLADLQARLDQTDALLADYADTLARLAELQSRLDSLEKQTTDSANSLAETTAGLQALSDHVHASDAPVATLRREVQLVKAMEMITRARLFLAQSNFGLARQDVQAAHVLLIEIHAGAPPYQQPALAAMVSRLQLASANLPGAPVVAADDLEIAWQLLAAGLPEQPAVATTPVGTASAAPPGSAATLAPTVPVTATRTP